mgnify:CR=1 FL=1
MHEQDLEEGSEDFKKLVTEIWESDKKKLKDEIEKLNLEIEEIKGQLDGKDEDIRKAKNETEEANELMQY